VTDAPSTWHYGVVARWWAEFNTSGPEIAYFQRFIEEDGEPAVDVACGTGRLLIPYLRAGLDIDGCDISADMIALCRLAAEREGLAPTLYVQPMHELDLPRRYQTVVVCGGFGLGGTREQDMQALERLFAHLQPGGRLLLDNEVPYSEPLLWTSWLKDGHDDLPRPWPGTGDRRVASDGSEYELRSRLLAFDPLEQRATREIRGEIWRDGELVESSTHVLYLTMYFKNELLLMLDRAGFVDVQVRGGYTDADPSDSDDFLVYIARKPAAAP
jgi:SAM-dependent methyltransferase